MLLLLAAAQLAPLNNNAPRPTNQSTPVAPSRNLGPPPPAPSADPHILNDWRGLRPTLAERGITPSVQFVSEFAANLSGGTSRDATNVTQLAIGVGADLKTLTGAIPGNVQLIVTKRSGPRLDDEAGLGLLQFSQETWGRGRMWRLTQGWYHVAIGRADLKLGRMGTGEDFHSARCDFQSLYFCAAGTGQILPKYWYNFPVSTWAMRVRLNISDKLYVQTGAYQVNPRNIDNETGGFYLGFKGGTGVLLPTEVGWNTRLFGTLPGTYKAGFLYSNAPGPDAVLDVDRGIRVLTGRPALVDRNQWAIFGNIRQQLVPPRPDGSHGVSVFFNGVWASQGTTAVESKFVAGLHYGGPIPGRPKDEIAIAVGRGRVNDRLTDLQRLLNATSSSYGPVRASEYTTEIYYGINALPGFVIRPNIQFTGNPGGDAGRANVVVLGMKLLATI
ncbi:MAG: carbohydrate porin [Sphingomonas paucimobilis]